MREIAKLCTSIYYGQPIVRTELAIKTFYQTNVDRVYDLTVVHPGVKLNCTHYLTLIDEHWSVGYGAKHILVNTERPVLMCDACVCLSEQKIVDICYGR